MSLKNFDKSFLNTLLFELAKEYRKINKSHTPIDLIIVGGGSILINYSFRQTTSDIDAFIHISSSLKDAIKNIAEKFDLPYNWLNSDFKFTDSYTRKLLAYSSFYKTFCHVLNVRTVKDEYLVAMKLMSLRDYKRDISDVVGIFIECEECGNPLTRDKIDKAVKYIYGSWDNFSEKSKVLLEKILTHPNLKQLYKLTIEDENSNWDKKVAQFKKQE